MILVDASAALDLLTDEGEPGAWVFETLAREDGLGAPHLIDLEVLSGLRKRLQRRELGRAAVRDALAGYGELPLVRYPVTGLLERIWQLRDRMTPYDASYVALAETLGMTLVTTDLRLARAGGHRARIVAYKG